MQSIDRAAIERLGIPRLLLMDRAGRAVAETALSLLGAGTRILACCGSGFNGGDGLCAARYLAEWGCRVRVLCTKAPRLLRNEPAIYARILQAWKVPIAVVESPDSAQNLKALLSGVDVVLDALLGVGLRGTVRPLETRVIDLMNHSGKPIVAVDIPSGIDGDTGQALGHAVRATHTVTFGLPKRGLFLAQGKACCGVISVDSLGLPPQLLRQGGRASP